MAGARRYIAFDLGAESGRCIVGELRDGRLHLHDVHRFRTHVVRYRNDLFWDILAIFEEMKVGLSRAVQHHGPRFDGMSVDTWGVDYVLLDAGDRLLGYPYHYRSPRTDGMMEKAFRIVPKEEIYRRTGIQFMQINTLYQLLAEKAQRRSLLDIAECFLTIPDFFHFLLSGVKRAEYTFASTTQLSDPWCRNWCWDLIKAFGLPEKIFPPIIESGQTLGPLVKEIMNEVGMEGEPPIIAGASHDTAAAVAAVPATEGTWAYLSSGTWSLMGIELDRPLVNDSSLERNFTNEGGVLGTVRFLKNIAGLWLMQECRRDWEKLGKRFEYDELALMAKEVPPVKAWVNPNDPRFLHPGNMAAKIISYLRETKQPFREEVSWITRCVLESLAFKYRVTLKELEELTGKRIERLHAVGGGIRNELLCQMTADAINREVIAGPAEGTVVGNLGIQAIATGELGELRSLRELVGSSFKLKVYKPQNPDYWDKHEEVYRSLSTG